MSKDDPVIRALSKAVDQRRHELSVASAGASNIETNVYSNREDN